MASPKRISVRQVDLGNELRLERVKELDPFTKYHMYDMLEYLDIATCTWKRASVFCPLVDANILLMRYHVRDQDMLCLGLGEEIRNLETASWNLDEFFPSAFM